MDTSSNKAFVFNSVPQGLPVAGKNIIVEDRPIDLSKKPPPGGLLAKNYYASFDPYQRGRMRDPSIKSYAPPYEAGSVICNSTISKVLKSGNEDFKEGDWILNWMAGPIEEYTFYTNESVKASVQHLNNPHDINPAVFLGALGMPGLTAFSSFYKIAEPKKGDTIFVSAASGAVGQFVGQLAKHEGLKVIGSVGNDDKLDFIMKELGFDGGFNYKKEKPKDALNRLAPDGIDIYFENVGGEHLEAAIDSMKNFGRIVVCGMVSQYNLSPDEIYPLRNLSSILWKRLKVQGFLVNDPGMGPDYRDEHQEKLQQWIHEGTFKVKMSTTHGIENAPEGFVGMLKGDNFGKAVLEIAKP